MLTRPLLALASAALLAGATAAQHSQVSAVVVDPTNPHRVWVCNRDTNTVSLIDIDAGVGGTGEVVVEVAVGNKPRSLAITSDGSKLLVANQRGDVGILENGRTGFAPGAAFGTVSVIDTVSLGVTTLTKVGVEPYGIAIAPNEKYFVVSGFRSGTLKAFDLSTHIPLAQFQYERTLNVLRLGRTVADVDEDRDGLPDVGDPRGFVIRSDSQRLYVTHGKSPWVSVVDVGLDAGGLPTGMVLAGKIQTNEYPFDPFFNPTPVQTVESQGLPRFLEDVALSPDGNHALVPHVLHNINHDVNHDFAGAIDGDFANRVYPALTVIDTALDSYEPGVSSSRRLHNEITDTNEPAEFGSYGHAKMMAASGNPILLGLAENPVLGGNVHFIVDGWRPGDLVEIHIGAEETSPRRPRERRTRLPRGCSPPREANSSSRCRPTAASRA